MSHTIKLSEARARLRRIVERLDAIATLYPQLDDELVSEIAIRIQDGAPVHADGEVTGPVQDLALFVVVNKAQFLLQGDAMAQLVTATEEPAKAGSN